MTSILKPSKKRRRGRPLKNASNGVDLNKDGL